MAGDLIEMPALFRRGILAATVYDFISIEIQNVIRTLTVRMKLQMSRALRRTDVLAGSYMLLSVTCKCKVRLKFVSGTEGSQFASGVWGSLVARFEIDLRERC